MSTTPQEQRATVVLLLFVVCWLRAVNLAANDDDVSTTDVRKAVAVWPWRGGGPQPVGVILRQCRAGTSSTCREPSSAQVLGPNREYGAPSTRMAPPQTTIVVSSTLTAAARARGLGRSPVVASCCHVPSSCRMATVLISACPLKPPKRRSEPTTQYELWAATPSSVADQERTSIDNPRRSDTVRAATAR